MQTALQILDGLIVQVADEMQPGPNDGNAWDEVEIEASRRYDSLVLTATAPGRQATARLRHMTHQFVDPYIEVLEGDQETRLTPDQFEPEPGLRLFWAQWVDYATTWLTANGFEVSI